MYGGLTSDSNFDAFLKLQNSVLFERPKPKDQTVLLAASISGGVVFLATLGLIGLRIWKFKLDNDARTLGVALQGSARKFAYKELEVATENFSSCLGEGGYGTVFSGKLADGRKVAVKLLQDRNQSQKNFTAEMASLGRISHQNVVQLYGFCSQKHQLMLVYEYMVNGSLDKWIFADRCLGWEVRCSISVGLARGIAYLHEESRQLILHLDIKPGNVLLDDDFSPKLADFGLAKLMKSRDVSQSETVVRGTPGYIAPEWILNWTATKKCDVYSYGMVLLELIGGRRNSLKYWDCDGGSDKMDEEELAYFPAFVVSQVRKGEYVGVVDAKIRDSVDQGVAKRLIHVALWCIQEDPSDRPSMHAVVKMLEGRKEILEPPLSFGFPSVSSTAPVETS